MTRCIGVERSTSIDRGGNEFQSRHQTLGFFIITILGFSFWFFMVVPFASHRESYWWLAMVHTEDFAYSLSFISSTYRPLHQAFTWLSFLFLDPNDFPTNVARQATCQMFIYGVFVLAWWQIYAAAPQRRLFALTALAAGGVFFSGYVHLFHLYGNAYFPVMLMLGALLRYESLGNFDYIEKRLAVIATVLVLWHPFTTAVFVGYYFGHCLDTFRQRTRQDHLRSVLILLVGVTAVATIIVALPRLWPGASALLVQTATRPLNTRLFAFLVSYRTNEVNGAASVIAFLLSQAVIFSLDLSRKRTLAAALVVTGLTVAFALYGLPILLLWICTVLVKLILLRRWGLFFLALTTTLLPFGGGIGTPMHALFAIIVAVYVTPLGWIRGEAAVSFLKGRALLATTSIAIIVILLVRIGTDVPIVTKVANRLLAERERTYQLENVLAWMRTSKYCDHEIAFAEAADLPIDSVESAITRRNRPPAALADVQLFWRRVLQCRPSTTTTDHATRTALVTFGGQTQMGLTEAYKVDGRYAGDATVWLPGDSK